MPRYKTKNYNRKVDTPDGFHYDENGTEVVDNFEFYDHYVITFTNMNDEILKIRSMVDRNVLDLLLGYLNFSKGTVTLNADRRAEIRKKLGITPQAFSRSMKNLTELGFIWKHGIYAKDTGEELSIMRDEIDINPKIFWKGDIKKRNELVGKTREKK